ncbi:hypothetical protein HDU98_007553 [Podochytrium sp. JEL0797]|nr:hypothetical protein HDU98_007553 [Podochytrium sp. JEL0797]
MILLQNSDISVQEIAHKGHGFICSSPAGIEDGTLLVKETCTEWWDEYSFTQRKAAVSLLAKSRSDPSIHESLQHLYPTHLDLVPEQVRNRPGIDAVVEEMTNLLQTAEPDSHSPPASREELLRFYFIIQSNSFPSGLLIAMSSANHSCNPNAFVFQETASDSPAPVYSLWSTRDIQFNEEITISYVDMVSNIQLCAMRRIVLTRKFLFDCDCEYCKRPVVKEGLLVDAVEEPLFGPDREDFICAAFYTVAGCVGAVSPLTGVCGTCHHAYNQTQVTYVTLSSAARVDKLRSQLSETNAFLAKLDSAQEGVDVLQELNKRKAELEESKLEAEKLWHATHLGFVPLDACLKKLASMVRREMYNQRRKMKVVE